MKNETSAAAVWADWPWSCAYCGEQKDWDELVKRPQPDRICRDCFDESCCQVCGSELGELEQWGKTDLVHAACREEVQAGPQPKPYNGPDEPDIKW